jgi:hypothetical protein
MALLDAITGSRSNRFQVEWSRRLFDARGNRISRKAIVEPASLVCLRREGLLRRPEQRLGDDDAVAAERNVGLPWSW